MPPVADTGQTQAHQREGGGFWDRVLWVRNRKIKILVIIRKIAEILIIVLRPTRREVNKGGAIRTTIWIYEIAPSCRNYCIVIGNDTGIYIGRLSVMNTVQGGAVQNNLSDNFWINGNGNTIKDLYLTQPTDSTSNSNGLGHISGEGNELINLNIVGDGTGTGFIVPGGKVEGHALTLTGFNVGVGFLNQKA